MAPIVFLPRAGWSCINARQGCLIKARLLVTGDANVASARARGARTEFESYVPCV